MLWHRQSTENVAKICTQLYLDLKQCGFDILFDDRDLRAGLLFADHELIGIPHRIVVSERNLEQGNIEYKGRRDQNAQLIPINEIDSFLQNKLKNK